MLLLIPYLAFGQSLFRAEKTTYEVPKSLNSFVKAHETDDYIRVVRVLNLANEIKKKNSSFLNLTPPRVDFNDRLFRTHQIDVQDSDNYLYRGSIPDDPTSTIKKQLD